MIAVMPAGADIFQSTAEAIVNPVNCVGIMGAGLAKEFRGMYPAMYEAYRQEVAERRMRIGHCHVYRLPSEGLRYIINLPTKYHWREKSSIAQIKQGLDDLLKIIEARKIRSVAIPALGCGNGGLDWDAVFKLLTETLDVVDCEIELYPPQGNNHE